jgi:hypothetical protein
MFFFLNNFIILKILKIKKFRKILLIFSQNLFSFFFLKKSKISKYNIKFSISYSN